MGWLTSKNQFPVDGNTMVVTGGSQGMGLSVAKKLAQRGANVVIVAQNIPKLENAVKIIAGCARHPQSQRFHFISADLRKADETDRVLSEVTAWNQGSPPDSVFLCAGNSLPGFFADTSSEVLRNQMDSIYWCAANMAHSTLKAWLKTPEKGAAALPTRHLVFTCSVLAFFPLAGYGPYNPAKAAIRSLADTLAQEFVYYNGTRHHQPGGTSMPEMKVHIVFPGGIQSPGFEIEAKSKPELTLKLEGTDVPSMPDVVADVTISGIENDKYMITMNWLGHLMKGAAFGTSPSNGWGIVDTFWTFWGWLIFRFIVWDFLRQSWGLGKSKGREIKGVTVSPYS